MTSTTVPWAIGDRGYSETDPDPVRQSNLRRLACGHAVWHSDHVWTTRNGADACRQECVNRLEQRGR